MSKYFSIEGYWKDDLSEFSDYIIKEFDDEEDDEDEVFYYGMSENDIINAIANPKENILEFIITSYKEIAWKN